MKSERKQLEERSEVLLTRFKWLQKYKVYYQTIIDTAASDISVYSHGTSAAALAEMDRQQREQAVANARKELTIIQPMLSETREQLKANELLIKTLRD